MILDLKKFKHLILGYINQLRKEKKEANSMIKLVIY